MIDVQVIRGNQIGNQSMMTDMFQLRHEVFENRLGWSVESSNGLEMDKYDGLDPVYMAAKNTEEKLQGCWRMLPTDGPYMMRDIFPELAAGESIPNKNNIWEISRWASVACESDLRAQAHANETTLELIKTAYDFAVENNIDHYIVVTSVAMERLVKRLGLPVRRFGNKSSTQLGNVLSVALWVDINEQFHQIVYPSKVA